MACQEVFYEFVYTSIISLVIVTVILSQKFRSLKEFWEDLTEGINPKLANNSEGS